MIDDGVAADARAGRTVETAVTRYEGSHAQRAFDRVVTEEPLELRLVAGSRTHTLAVTMRTPGNDFELAAGFVASERIVRAREAIAGVSYCVDPAIDSEQRFNIVNIELRSPSLPDLTRFERHFTINSSCGVCGRANLEALADLGVEPVRDDVRVPIARLYELPDRVREAQRIFSLTGGLHAAALFDSRGAVLAVREDVGRHNAVDKLAGWAFLEGRSPAGQILFVSGRASYEILQKAAVARIPIVAAVSAPSSLAVDLARAFNITLAGFVRGERANVYSVPERITA
ncbi:MAG TPA: formate dehydrogenase accessory sulfurtransferase FdhD [Candidatus Baltobacteraceae bacterium]|nr:formate dehydrogenase accessory sulfurtransferase FdhD [Candidatus Baltobacteraceae bacterium]